MRRAALLPPTLLLAATIACTQSAAGQTGSNADRPAESGLPPQALVMATEVKQAETATAHAQLLAVAGATSTAVANAQLSAQVAATQSELSAQALEQERHQLELAKLRAEAEAVKAQADIQADKLRGEVAAAQTQTAVSAVAAERKAQAELDAQRASAEFWRQVGGQFAVLVMALFGFFSVVLTLVGVWYLYERFQIWRAFATVRQFRDGSVLHLEREGVGYKVITAPAASFPVPEVSADDSTQTQWINACRQFALFANMIDEGSTADNPMSSRTFALHNVCSPEVWEVYTDKLAAATLDGKPLIVKKPRHITEWSDGIDYVTFRQRVADVVWPVFPDSTPPALQAPQFVEVAK